MFRNMSILTLLVKIIFVIPDVSCLIRDRKSNDTMKQHLKYPRVSCESLWRIRM
jgi:hypothetical protein